MNEFVDRIRKSGLVDPERLRVALASFGHDPTDKVPLARHLIGQGILTKWQCQQILDGRYKGFFLGKYKLLDTLGRGGMSMVFVAEHIGMRRRVAVKVLPKSRTKDASFLERFQREARALAALTHPRIVRAYDFDCHDDTHYLVMEWVDGRTLSEVVEQEHPIAFSRIVEFIAQAADGLQYAHEAGFIHRDVKPANILVDHQDRVKLLDLGLAMLADNGQSSVTLEHNEKVLGTADYLAPEQALNSHEVDPRADIYALGCTLYFALTGHPPYPGGSIAQKIAQHQSALPPDPRKLRIDCPEQLAELCLIMMQKSPADRTPSAADVAKQLSRFGQGFQEVNDPLSTETIDWSHLGTVGSKSTVVDDLAIGIAPEKTTAAGGATDLIFSKDATITSATADLRSAKRRRRGFPWWIWASMLGLLVAAVWMLNQLKR